MSNVDPNTAAPGEPAPGGSRADQPVSSAGGPPAGQPVSSPLQIAASALLASRRPLLFCHRSPDGDTVGAAVALAMALRRLGIAPTISCADPLPPSVAFMPGGEMLSSALPQDPDLLVTLDISDPGMLGALRGDMERLRAGRVLLNIDHHASDTEYGDLNVVDASAASTAEMVYDLIGLFGLPIDTPMATALLTGIINDTHSFQNSNSSPRAFHTAAELVAAGADPAMITYNLLLRRRPQAALLWARTLATMRLDDEGRVSSAYATAEMMDEYGADANDLDGVVDFLRNIDGVDLAFLLKGTPEGEFKASVRTTGRVDAVELTAPFGGGGHRRAAGCDLQGPPDAARAALVGRYHELVGSAPVTPAAAPPDTLVGPTPDTPDAGRP